MIERCFISVNQKSAFHYQVSQKLENGWVISPNTMFVGTVEVRPSNSIEEAKQQKGQRFFKEVYSVQMEREKPDIISLDGLEVQVWRSETSGKLVVFVDTENLSADDEHPDNVPNITIGINDSYYDIDADGEFVADELK